MKKKKKSKKWIKPYHGLVRNIAFLVLTPYTRWKFGIKVERFAQQGDRQYLIVMNHQTVFDQFFIGMSFRGPIYYIATEDIFSNGWVSRLIRFLVAPIPIKKQTTDVQAVMNCLRIVKEGGTIALAPEGNRTYSGRTGYIKPSIVKLARTLKLPLAIYRIEGGYGVQPRWSDVIRKGRMHAGVTRVLEPQEIAAMSDEELYQLIQKELWVDEASESGIYRHQKAAEYLERTLYVCPECGFAGRMESRGEEFWCNTCGRKYRYRPDKTLEGVGFDAPFRYVADWYDYQCDYVNRTDPRQFCDAPLYEDVVRVYRVILYKNKKCIRTDAVLRLYGNRVTIDDTWEIPFDTAGAFTVLGRNKLNIYCDGEVWQIKGTPQFNALKYVNLFHRYKNVSEGNADGEFLGL